MQLAQSADVPVLQPLAEQLCFGQQDLQIDHPPSQLPYRQAIPSRSTLSPQRVHF